MKNGKNAFIYHNSTFIEQAFFSSNSITTFVGVQMQNPCAHKIREPYSLATFANLQRTAPRNPSGSVQ